MLLQELYQNSENERGWCGTVPFELPKLTDREKTIQEILLKFMEENGQGGCPAFSPDFLLKNIKPILLETKKINRIGKSTLEGIFKKSPVLLYDNQVTGTVSMFIYATIKYKFTPVNEMNVIVAKIGGQDITKGERLLRDVRLTDRYFLPIQIKYSGIVEWELEITKITTNDGIELYINNFSETGIKVINNKTVIVRDKVKVNRNLETSEK